MTGEHEPAPEAKSFDLDTRVAREFGRFAGGFWRGETGRWRTILGLCALIVVASWATLLSARWSNPILTSLEARAAGSLIASLLQSPLLIAAGATAAIIWLLRRETPEIRRAWLLVLGLAACLALSTGATVVLSYWSKVFFDALEQRDVAAFKAAALLFPLIIAAMAAIGVGIVLTRETLQVRWRAWLVENLLERWLDKQRFYHLNISGREPPNPEYRISDDTRWATEVVVDLAIGLFSAVNAAIAFISILWVVGGSAKLGGLTIPAYMVVVALAYGVSASAIMLWIGKPLVGRVGTKNEAEGYFRFAMMRLRDNAESVALAGGAKAEAAILSRFYSAVVARWLAIVKSHGHVTWITNAAGPMVPIVPLLAAAPKYLAGELTLGQVTQLAAAFVQVQIAISWLVDNYNRIAEWYASARRVMDIVDATEQIDIGGASLPPAAHIMLADSDDPTAVPVAGLADLATRPGETIHIQGASGAGKTTLVRLLAGLAVPIAKSSAAVSGQVRPATRLLILPQKAYIPLGTLADAVTYPRVPGSVPRPAIQAALRSVGLTAIAERTDELARWDQVLSSGERQRLSLARLLVQAPDVAILDDTFSAIETPAEAAMMAILRRQLPRTVLIVLGQRAPGSVDLDRLYRLEDADNGRILRRVRTSALIPG